jgi:hypothetical protein
MADDTPLDKAARHMRFTAEPLCNLLKAYKSAVIQDQWDTAESIAQAIYKSRENEIIKLVDLAKAQQSTGDAER